MSADKTVRCDRGKRVQRAAGPRLQRNRAPAAAVVTAAATYSTPQVQRRLLPVHRRLFLISLKL